MEVWLHAEEKVEVFNRRNGGGEDIISTTVYKNDKSWVREIAQFGDDILLNNAVTNGNSSDAYRVMDLISRIYNSDKQWQELRAG